MKKRRECGEYRCTEPLYRDGLCEQHYEEYRIKKLRKAAAVETLNTGLIDGRLADNQELHEELMQVRKWWYRACDSINSSIKHEVLGNEAKDALEWCIALAQEVIDEELAFRLGKNGNNLSKVIKKNFWERFKNMEAGLMSNGVPRSNT